MTTEEQSLLLLAILRNQMAVMMGLAELMNKPLPSAQDVRSIQALCVRHEETRQLIENLKP